MVKQLFKYKKKAILCFALLMVCTLSACSLSGQSTTSSNDANQSASTSAEASIPELPAGSQGDMVTEVPAVYAELLDTYVAALNEKWDGNALMEQGLNLMALDLYDGAPLDSSFLLIWVPAVQTTAPMPPYAMRVWS